MNIEELREFCLQLRAANESFPFDEETLVFKVENKMFLLLPLGEEQAHVSIKCAPEENILLQDKFAAAQPAFHLNKKHWLTLYLERDMNAEQIKALVLESYRLVISKLPLKIRQHYLDLL